MDQTIQNFKDLIKLFLSPHYAQRYSIAKATRTCVACGKPANTFEDCLARLEYECSGICEECQERYLTR